MNSPTQPPAVSARGLVKHYGTVKALDGLDLDVPAGTVLGLLGPNGAGKTTAVSILTTLVPPDSGSAVVAGVDVIADPKGARARIGLSGQYAAVASTECRAVKHATEPTISWSSSAFSMPPTGR
jgi:ABC-2 type transport system ATP-binding protein